MVEILAGQGWDTKGGPTTLKSKKTGIHASRGDLRLVITRDLTLVFIKGIDAGPPAKHAGLDAAGAMKTILASIDAGVQEMKRVSREKPETLRWFKSTFKTDDTDDQSAITLTSSWPRSGKIFHWTLDIDGLKFAIDTDWIGQGRSRTSILTKENLLRMASDRNWPKK